MKAQEEGEGCVKSALLLLPQKLTERERERERESEREREIDGERDGGREGEGENEGKREKEREAPFPPLSPKMDGRTFWGASWLRTRKGREGQERGLNHYQPYSLMLLAITLAYPTPPTKKENPFPILFGGSLS